MKDIVYKYLSGVIKAIALFFIIVWTIGCENTISDKYLNTFTGDMVYSYLKKDSTSYSEFVKLIDRAGLKGMLSAYGDYTCLAPTNAAFEAYYKTKGENFSSKDLTDKEVAYIVKTHIIGQKYLVQALSDGVIPTNNMNDRVVEILYTVDSVYNTSKVVLNKESEIIGKDIEVYNGVIQKIDHVLTPATAQLPFLISADSNLAIFSSALQLTGLSDSLLAVEDKSYVPVSGYKDEYNKYAIPSPPARKYGFSVFVESDDLFKSKGIKSLEELIAKVNEWYPSPGYENDFTNRNNSLNKFISYHLVEKAIYSNQFFFSTHAVQNADLYEYIETMYDYRLIKVSNQNPKTGTAALINPNSGNEVYITNKYSTTVNGVYHYLADILLYTGNVENTISNSRVRFDYSALFPEMMNNNLRLSNTQKNSSGDRYGIPPGYFKYMKATSDTRVIYLAGSTGWCNYQGDEMMGLGNYDITVRLLPIPPGTYELRFAYTANGNRSITQIYVDGKPVGIPLNLTINGTDPKIGAVPDAQTDDSGVENDKTMRNRGYLKGPVTYGKYESSGSVITARSTVSLSSNQALRRIIGVYTFDTYGPHYVRFKSVVDKPTAQCMMDYFEYVPKSIYAPAGGGAESRD